MPSPADRRWLERGLRGVACAALGALLLRAWRPSGDVTPPLAVAQVRSLPAVLARATQGTFDRLDLAMDSLPGARDRQWLRALAGAGTTVRWSAVGAVPVATVVEPVADPSGRARITASSRPGSWLTLRDAAGTVDSSALAASGVRSLDATVSGTVRAATPHGAAVGVARDSILLRPVLLLGRAGWEGKFVAAALEEAGWRVDARFRVAPNADVRQGTATSIDTAHYAAVVALDESAAAEGASIARFVRSGGGAIIARPAARVAPLAALLPAREGGRRPPRLGGFSTDTPRRALDGVALVVTRPDAVVLDGGDREARVVGARLDAGRVVQLGYDETWRWRMEGDDRAPAAHRAWWSSLLASVAYAPLAPLAPPMQLAAGTVDEVPYASLVDALGPPVADVMASRDGAAPLPWDPLLFAIFLVTLLAEWSSRRLRGAR